MAVRFVALLRGVNVGTARRVAMSELRGLVEELGYRDVRTLLNSGNVVFDGAGLEPRAVAQRIEKALETTLRVSARVMVVSAEELADVVEGNPLGKVADNPSRLLVGILGDREGRRKLAEIAKQDWGEERIALGPAGAAARSVYMWLPHGVIKSKLSAAVNKVLGDGVTSRNWSTMLKLHAMAEERRG